MTVQPFVRRFLLGAATLAVLAVAGIALPIAAGALTPAYAQSADDMAAALDAYGRWMRDPRYGNVWVPDGVPADWRPYEYGHWVYTDDWGWYWVSDDQEDDWGWVVYHYGRWVHDRGSWFWVPGDDWAPAWVDWRYGGDDIGWAPMPPDDLVDAYDDDAEYWSFVPLRYIGDPELRRYYVPRDRHTVILRETRIINRPVHIEGRRVWVNPGLAPGFITGRTHVALHAYNVRPRVFGATAGVQGAVTIRRDELRKKGDIRRVAPVSIQRTTTAIAPVTGAQPPKPLGKGERGQLGIHPPRAAQGGTPQQQQQTAPSGGPPHSGPAPVINPAIKPANPAVVPKQPPGTPQTQERREIHPPAGNAPAGGTAPAGGNAPAVHPNGPPPPPPPPKQPAPPPPRPVAPPPPPVVHAPPPPVVHAPPPPVVHAPPPPVVHAPPPPPVVHAPPPAVRQAPPPAAAKPAAKPGEKPAEVPK